MNIDQIRRTPIYQAGLIHFGQATGHLSTQRFDGWAPDPGLPFVMEVEALSTHMLCVGSTGQGKTSAVIKPTVCQFLRSNVGGCLLACGKGALAADFAGLRNYIRLSPKRCVVALLEGLSPHDALQTLVEVNVSPGDKGQKDPIWDSLTRTHLRHAIYLLHALIEISRDSGKRVWFWSVWDWVRMANLPVSEEALLLEYIAIVRAQHPGAKEGLLREALVYFETQFPEMEPKLRDGALGQVMTWTTDLLSHPGLLEWAKAETGVNPEACLYADEQGNCWTVGIDLPEVTYGDGGKTATAFIKARIYSAIKRRSDAPDGSWATVDPKARPVLIVQDEFQLIATQSDYDLSPIGRQLGAWMLIASQTVESIYAKAGGGREHGVNAFLDAFQSRIALSTSIATVKWLQEWQGFGTAWIPQFGSTQRTLNLVASAANALRSPIHERNHPSRFWFQRLRRQGVGGFLNSLGRLDIPSDTSKADLLASTLITGKGWKEEHLLQLADFNAMTKTKGVTLACVMRAGTVRRDFIQLNRPEDGIPADLRESTTETETTQEAA